MGDESEVSALSAVSEEDLQQQELAENQKTVTHRNLLPKGGHKRNVSWGVYDAPSSKGSADSPSAGSVNLQQPDLTGTGGGRGGTMNGISGGGTAPKGPLPPSLKPKLQVQRNKTVDSIISNLSPNPGHNRTNTRITLTDLTVSLYFLCMPCVYYQEAKHLIYIYIFLILLNFLPPFFHFTVQPTRG